jgi:hypothetical protein
MNHHYEIFQFVILNQAVQHQQQQQKLSHLYF